MPQVDWDIIMVPASSQAQAWAWVPQAQSDVEPRHGDVARAARGRGQRFGGAGALGGAQPGGLERSLAGDLPRWGEDGASEAHGKRRRAASGALRGAEAGAHRPAGASEGRSGRRPRLESLRYASAKALPQAPKAEDHGNHGKSMKMQE